MIAVIYSIIWTIAAWKWVDWRNWRMYYPTALFSAVGNLLYEVICSKYQLWAMETNGLPNRTLPILLLSIVGMPISIIVYLSNYPEKRPKMTQALYILLFIIIFGVLELISVKLGAITYHNGWNFYWSLLFDVMMFIILIIHHRNPKWAWLLSAGTIIVIMTMFNLTLDKMK
jgi:CDP-diglyceride synthetase